MTNEKFNIICLSNQSWDFPLPTNKKQVMSRLSKRGHNVLFIDTPFNLGRSFSRQLLKGQWGLKRLISKTYNDEGVLIYSPLNVVPNGNITSKIHAKKVSKLTKKYFDPSLKTIFWIYHVETVGLFNYVEILPYDILIYDCVDNYEAFPDNSFIHSTTVSKNKLVSQEKELTQRADLVFATAPGLVEKLSKYRDKVHFTPNVGDYPKFSKAPQLKSEIPEDLERIRRPRVGFTGAVDEYKLDIDMVKGLAKRFPKYSFVIIGPMAMKDREATTEELGFDDLNNVHFLGTRPYDILEKYYAGFDAFMIPYQLNDYTVGGCFPVKYHDALAAGLPTIVTDLPAYAPFKDVTYIAKNEKEFANLLEKALKEDSKDKIDARQKVAKENDWDGKVNNLLSLIYTETNKNS